MESFIKNNYTNEKNLNYWIHNLFYESINLYKRGYRSITFSNGTRGYKNPFFINENSVIFPDIKKLTVNATIDYKKDKLNIKHILLSKNNNIKFLDFLEIIKVWNCNEQNKIIFLEDFPRFKIIYDEEKKEMTISNFVLEADIVDQEILKDKEKFNFFITGEFFLYNSFNNCICN